MGVAVGGPCVGLKKHQGAQVEPPQLCAAVTSHKWYSGPTCKNCYERNKTEGRKRPKMARTEDAPAESGGNIPLVCLRVSAARCALPPVAPALSPPACIARGRASRRVLWACTDYRSSHGRWWTGATLRRSQTMTRATNASSTTSTRLVQVRVRRRRCATPRSSVGAAARSGAGRRLEGGGSEVGGEAEEGQQCSDCWKHTSTFARGIESCLRDVAIVQGPVLTSPVGPVRTGPS